MKELDVKFEVLLVILSMFVFFSLSYLILKWSPASIKKTIQDVTYEMPRPTKSLLSFIFDLQDREIDKSFQSLPKKISTQAMNHQTVHSPPIKSLDKNKENPISKKKSEQKKSNKIKDFSVRVVNNDESQVKEDESVKSSSDKLSLEENLSYIGVPKQNKVDLNKKNETRLRQALNPETTDSQVNDQNDLTEQDWRDMVLKDPSVTNIEKMIVAFQQQKLDENSYLNILDELVQQTDIETQKRVVKALLVVYSAKSFILASHLLEDFNLQGLSIPEQTLLKNYMQNFKESGRINLLASIVQTADVVAVRHATDVILLAYNESKKNNSQSQQEIKNYQNFVGLYTELMQSNDPQLIEIAEVALQEIGSDSVITTKLAKK